MFSPAPDVIDAVTFDYWNTLCWEPDTDQRRDLVCDAYLDVLTDAGREVTRDALVDAYDAARREFWRAWSANEQFTGNDAARFVFGTITEAVDDPLLDRLLDAFHACSETVEVVPVDGVAAVLQELRRRGVRVGIICDVGLMASPYLRRHLSRHGLLEHFDHWSFSDEVGVYKPDRKIFEHALAGLGRVAPERAAHIGDRRRTDVAGARTMGMRAVRITAVFDDDDPEEGPSGDVVIDSYAGLLDALELS